MKNGSSWCSWQIKFWNFLDKHFYHYIYDYTISMLIIRPFEKRDVLWERPWRAGRSGGRRPILSGAYLLHVWRDFNETS
jgi:hypothetical protein